jgi:hypothetical protein
MLELSNFGGLFMKKFFAFGLVVLFLAPPPPALLADDAKVMPGRVGRFYAAPVFGFATEAFDTEGKRGNLPNDIKDIKLFNLGFALEYGIIDWITAAVQWAPGWNAWSAADQGKTYDSNINGVADLFVGAKIQIIGASAPVANETFRLAFAPGVKIPMPGPDFAEEAKNNDVRTINAIDKHVLGVGLRTYFDYIINEHFFINLYNEFLYYPLKGDVKNDATGWGIASQAYGTYGSSLSGAGFKYGNDVTHGFDLTFELEPVFTYPIASGVSLSAGLPVNYKTVMGKKYDITIPGNTGTALDQVLATLRTTLETAESPTHLLMLKPNVSFFFTSWVLPVEFKLLYGLPVWGQNNQAMNQVVLQIKAYFRIGSSS